MTGDYPYGVVLILKTAVFRLIRDLVNILYNFFLKIRDCINEFPEVSKNLPMVQAQILMNQDISVSSKALEGFIEVMTDDLCSC